MASRKLKLFVWHDVLVDYTTGKMFALAHDVDEARALITNSDEGRGSPIVLADLQGEPEVHEAPAGFLVWGGS